MSDVTGVYLDYDTKLTTLMVAHRKCVVGNKTYFIGKMPEGDYAIHETMDGRGYGGSNVGFLMEDGTFETVKGPYSRAGLFDFGRAEELAKAMGCPDIAIAATRLTVGRNLRETSPKLHEVIFEEPELVLGDWSARLRPEWSGMDVAIKTRSGTSYRKCP